MILDNELVFDSNAEHLTTEASTNLIDLSAIRDIGTGEDLYCVVAVTVAFTDGSSNSTMAVTLESDDSASFGSAATAQTLGTFAALSAIGTRLVVKLNPVAINERYLRVKYTVANGDLSTGKFDAFLVKDIQRYVSYADNITIS